MWIHLLALGLIDGAGGGVTPTQQDAPSGGWTQSRARKRTKQERYEERVRLGIFPKPVIKAAKKIAEVAHTVEEFKEERPRYEEMFMQSLKVSKWLPDYTRAIQAQLKIIEQDEEEILLLL